MTTDALPATLSFLTDAAHILMSASPETSAHLMLQRNSLMFNNNLNQSDVQRQRVCGCCGHIMIAGLGDVLKMDSSKTCHNRRRGGSKQKKAGISPRSGCRKTWTCGQCGRYTTISLPPPACAPQRRYKQTPRPTTTILGSAAGTASSSSTATAPPPPPLPLAAASSSEPTRVSANASSKKRAKNRKQGLQALLQQSASSKSQSGLGLSLADFMQS
ncbi:hypothetical protein F5Y12DRAFT_86061 [Xylaria sp. FL1777]|nr:hypothetical protein F5Y12DRAFT_86061 [Xylaria sp. FL1777]